MSPRLLHECGLGAERVWLCLRWKSGREKSEAKRTRSHQTFFLLLSSKSLHHAAHARPLRGAHGPSSDRDWVHAVGRCLCSVPPAPFAEPSLVWPQSPLEIITPPNMGRPSTIDLTPHFVTFDFSSRFSKDWKTAQLGLGESEEVDGHWKTGKHEQRHTNRC